MKADGFKIYFLADEQRYLLGFSKYPALAMKYYIKKEKFSQGVLAVVLTEGLRLSLVEYIYRRLTTKLERQPREYQSLSLFAKVLDYFWQLDLKAGQLAEKEIKLQRLLNKFSVKDKFNPTQLELAELERVKLPDKVAWKQLYQLLQGKRLYKNEIEQSLRENKLVINDLERSLSYLQVAKGLEILAAIKFDPFTPVCQRCGSQELIEFDCLYCQKEDYYCKSCLLSGEARGCKSMYQLPLLETKQSLNFVEPRLEFELTALQAEISNSLVQFLANEQKKRALVWAVCGAGKTEVVFKAIAKTLNQGGKVLFAIPRRDVVVELEERLQEAFPEVKIKGLYGGSQAKYKEADLVIATVHQLIRYHRAFDLVILDEMDAFPYQNNRLLKRSLEKSKRETGKMIYMTATPLESDLARFQAEDAFILKLSARYHGYPLPEPKLLEREIDYDLANDKLELTPEIIDLIKASVRKDERQLFIFVPLRELVGLTVSYLRKKLSGLAIKGSHSQDENRELKREEFSAGKYPILVSTTIMERGITVDQANVLVLFAELDYIFTQQSLIQMAGRAGRSIIDPEGRVYFVANEITTEMKEARDKIRNLNQDAARRGYLKEEFVAEYGEKNA